MAIVYKIGFEADTSGVEAGLKSIASEIDKTMRRPGMFEGLGEELKEGVRQARILEQALSKATSASGISFTKLNTEIQKAGSSVKDMVTGLSNAGMTNSLNQMLEAFSRADRQLVTINKRVQELGRVMTQSFKFSMAQEALQSFRNGLSEVVNYVKELDSAMNSIQIVTGKTADQMTSVTQNAIESARQLRVSAKDYADASLIFYQQGLADEEVKRRSDTTIMAAKAAGESVSQMSQELTAVWNTYQMEGEQLERAASIGAKLGAETAVDFKYIAEAMGIAATSAAQLGTSYESLSSIIATVGSVTQQSASVIGTAYRTIFTRLSNLKLDGETEDGVNLGQITKQLAEVGVSALDANGELRKTDELIMELGTHWGEYSQAQQAAIAQVVGGTRQFGQFLALMQNFDIYLQNLQSAMSETGAETLTEQYETSLDTIDSKMTNAAEAWKRAFAQIFTADSLKGFYGVLEDVGNGVENLIDGFGGIQSVVVVIGKLLSKHVVSALFDASKAMKTMWENRDAEHALGYMNKQIREMQDGIKKTATERVNMLMSSNSPTRGMEADITTSRATYDMMRVEATQQATQANILLNEQIAKGNEETRIRAESLQIQVDAMRQQTIEAINTTQALEKQARMSRERVDKDGEARSRSLFAAGGKPEEDAMVNADKAVGSLTKAYQNLFKVMNSGEDVSEDLRKSVVQDINNINSAIDNIGKNESPAIQQLGAQLKQQLEEVQNQLKVGESIDFTSMNSSLANSTSLMRSFMQAVEQSDVSLTDLGDGSEVMGLLQILSQLSVESNELQVNMQTLNSLVRQTGEATTSTNVSAQTLATGFVNLGGNIAMVIQGFTTLGQTMADDNATMMDYIGSLAMLAPSLIMAGMETASLVKNLALKITATLGSAAADAVAAGATGGWAAMNVILSASFGPILIAVLAIVAAIAALVAIVWLVVKAFKAWQASTPEGKLKAAQESAEKLNQTLEETKSAADTVKNSFQSYNDIVSTLDDLKKGTAEWSMALLEANQNMLTIMKLFPEFRDQVKVDENGLLYFDQDTIDKINKEVVDRTTSAQIGANLADSQVREAERQASDVKKRLDNFAEDMANDNKYQQVVEQYPEYFRNSMRDVNEGRGRGVMYQLYEGDTTGNTINPKLDDDTFLIIAQSIESSVDTLAKLDPAARTEELKNIIRETKSLNSEFAEGTQGEGNNYTAWTSEQVDAIAQIFSNIFADYDKDLNEYAAMGYSNIITDQAQLRSTVTQILGQNQEYQSSDNQTAIQNIANTLGRIVKDGSIEKFNDLANADQETIDLAIEAIKKNNFLLEGATAEKLSDGSGYKIKGTTVDNKEFEENFTWDDLKKAGIGADFLNSFQGRIDKILNIPEKIEAAMESQDETTRKNAEAIDKFLQTSDIKTLPTDFVQQMSNASDQQIGDMLDSVLGDGAGGFTDEEAQALGADSANQFIQAFKEGFASADLSDISTTVKNMIDTNKLGISQIAAETITDIVEGSFGFVRSENIDPNFVGPQPDYGIRTNFQKGLEAATSNKEFGERNTQVLEETIGLLNELDPAIRDIADLQDRLFDGRTLGEMQGNLGALEDFNNELRTRIDLNDKLNESLASTEKADGVISDEEAEELGISQEILEEYVKTLEDQADAEKKSGKQGKVSQKTLAEIAEETFEAAEAANQLNEFFEEQGDSLEDLEKGSVPYLQAMAEINKQAGELLDLDTSLLSSDFWDGTTLSLLEQAANGSAEAIDQLKAKAREDIIMNILIDTGMTEQEAITARDSIQSWFDQNPMALGATIDDTQLIAGLQNIITQLGLTQTEAAAILDAMGYDVKFKPAETTQTEMTEYPQGYTVDWTPTERTNLWTNPDGTTIESTQTVWQPTYKALPTKQVPTTSLSGAMGMDVIPGGDGNFEIESVTKRDIPSSNITSTMPATRSAPSSSGGGKKGGGGGGGGGSSSFKPKEKRDPRDQAEDLKEKEDMEELVERYENIDRALEDNAAALEQAGDAGDRLFGKGRAQALMEQNKLLEEQNELLDWQIKEAEKYAFEDKNKLTTEFGISEELLETNEDGSLKYREQIMQILEDRQEQQRQAYNAEMAQIHSAENQLVDQYNAAGDASEEADKAYENASKELEYQKKALDDKWEGQQQKIQDTIDTLDEFEEAGARVFDGTQQKLENLREMWDNAFEAKHLYLDLRIELTEGDRDFFEYVRDGLGEGFEDAAEKTQYFKREMSSLGETYRIAQKKANDAWWEMKQALEADPDAVRSQEDIWNEFDSAYETLMEIGEQFREVAEGLKETYIEALEDLQDRWDELNGEVERQQDLISGMNDLLRETGRIYTDNEDSIKIMDNYVESMSKSLITYHGEYENATKRELELQQQLKQWENSGNQELIDQIKEELQVTQEWKDEAMQSMLEAGASLASAVTEAMEHFRDVGEEAWMDQVSTMFNSFEDGAELLDQKLDLENYYMHENDKAFAIEEMIWQIEDAIEATSDPGQLDKYQELLDDLNAKKTDGKKVTEDEMAIYKAQLDLMLEQSRLEDARNAKNSMRLARDASGNWSYVYSQDTSETEDLERSIAEKQHNIDKMWRDYEQSREQEYYQILQDMHDFQQSKNDQLYATDENYRNWYDSRYNMYKEQLNNSANEINKALDHTGNDFKETALGYVLDMDNMDEANKKYQGEIDKWEEACENKYNEYADVAGKTFESVGLDMEDLSEIMVQESNTIIGKMGEVSDKVTNLQEESDSAFSAMIASQNVFREHWVENMELIIAINDRYLEQMKEFKKAAQDGAPDNAQGAFDELIKAGQIVGEDYRYNPEGHAGDEAASRIDADINSWLEARQTKLEGMTEEERSKVASNEDIKALLMTMSPSDMQFISDLNRAAQMTEDQMYEKYLTGWEGDKPIFDAHMDDFAAGLELLKSRGLTNNYMYRHLREARQRKINMLYYHDPERYADWYDWEDPNGFYNRYAKGGYTGNGSLSKGDHIPALLSSQEYVLNPEDTKNILHAVKVTRDIVQARVNGVLSNLAAQYLNITPQTGTQQSELKQKVKIEANFPNVQNRTEIEAAFDNLINKAAQYVLKDE